MSGPSTADAEQRTLVLAPLGRDSAIAAAILRESGREVCVCRDIPSLCAELEAGASAALVAEEALYNADLTQLATWIAAQPPWSDFPFILLAHRGAGLERNPAAGRLVRSLGNVSFLERPFHPTTLVSMVQTALRGRSRQYEARERIRQIREAEARLEARVKARTIELERANSDLAEQIAEREKVERALRQSQRLEAVGQLTSGVAHDFNNLLTVVLGNVRQLQKSETEPRNKQRLDMIVQAAERGARLTAQMLAFSRRQKLEPKPVDLNETVAGMRDLLQSTLGGSVHIEVRPQPGLWLAMIDPTQIELVILNLAINGRDAMEVGGSLTIETANVTLGAGERPEEPPAGDYVMLSVRDTGSGMTQDVLEKVFEPFFTTKEVGKGSGLGLSQVFGLAKQSGGGVRIDTRVGEGSSIKVFLPRAEGATRARENDAREGVLKAQGDRLILLVDDDEAVREVTSRMLSDLGYRVLEADGGAAALELAEQPDIDLALLDFAMPGMNGAGLARELRRRRPGLPILFATGYADAEVLTEAGEDQIVRKPLDERELALKLARRLTADEVQPP